MGKRPTNKGKIPIVKVRKIPANIAISQRKDALVYKLSKYLDEPSLISLSQHISEAIPLARRIVDQRDISAQVIAEDAGFYHDPFIIPTALAEYTQVGPSTIIAALLFASLRPARGGDPNVDDMSMLAMQEFVEDLPGEEYADVPDIIMGALRMRALEPPPPLRKIQTLEDLLAEPTIEEAKNNQRRLAMIMIAADDNRAITLRLAQQLVRLQRWKEALPELDSKGQEALLKELYYMRHSYIPLADRLGQRKLVEAMQDQVLRLADPTMHQRLHENIGRYAHRFDGTVNTTDKTTLIDNLCQLVSSKLHGIEGLEVYGRVKSPYSLWLKMHEKGATVESLEKVIFDYIGITARFNFPGADKMTNQESRGLAQKIGIDIYNQVRRQRSLFTVVPQTEKITDLVAETEGDGTDKKRKKSHRSIVKSRSAMEVKENAAPTMVNMRNYMEHPKANGYSAIHVLLQVNVAQGVAPLIDFHIVWKKDDDNNTYGNASHAHYKAAVENSAAAKVLEQWRAAGNEIYVQVGDGRIRRFQKGSTIADVAERIHTDMVAVASGAMVTRTDPSDPVIEKKRSLRTEVKNGDKVVVLLYGTEHFDRLISSPRRRKYTLQCLRPDARRKLQAFYRKRDKAAGLDS